MIKFDKVILTALKRNDCRLCNPFYSDDILRKIHIDYRIWAMFHACLAGSAGRQVLHHV